MLIKKLSNYNSVAVTHKKIPLPLENEQLFLFHQNVNLNIIFNNFNLTGFGTLYISNLRFIFINLQKNDFHSFSVPLKNMFLIKNDIIEFIAENNYLIKILLNYNKINKTILINTINEILKDIVMEVKHKVSYYTEIEKNNN